MHSVSIADRSCPRRRFSRRMCGVAAAGWGFWLAAAPAASFAGDEVQPFLTANQNPFIQIFSVPAPPAARLVDPDAFVICAACMKTHNIAVVTLSIKNMVLGAPLHQAPKETARWNDKRRYHVGIRQSQIGRAHV